MLHTRDARYTCTGKIPVSIIFQTVRYHNLLISVFRTLLFRSSPVGGSASKIAANPVNLTTEQRDDQTD